MRLKYERLMTRDVTPVKMSEIGLLFGCVQITAALLTGSDILDALCALHVSDCTTEFGLSAMQLICYNGFILLKFTVYL